MIQEEMPEPLPPRSRAHPSEKGRWTARFYATLVLLFIGLIVFLILWFGYHMEAG